MTDVDTFKNALNSFSDDEDSFIKLVTNYTISQRLKLKKAYKDKFNSNILEDIKNILVEKYKDLMFALFTNAIEYDCIFLKNSLKENESDIETILEIVSNKPIWLINKIKEKYSEKFSEDLEENIKNNIKDENIQNLILILLNSEKDDNKEFNIEESKNQAKELFEAEDEEITEIFYNIIKNSSQKELSIIVREYHKLSNKTILDFIKENIPNEIQNYVNSIVFLIISPSEYFAKRINSIIKDLNNDIKINLLIRILVSRSELDLTQIIHYYKALFNKEIIDDIKENINSDYQMALIELCSH